MMSFRKAVDATLIAQLVGRMVRTPLARSVETNEFLNTVSLYLPHYDPSGLDSVISRLTTPDAELIPPVDIAKGEDVITLTRAKGSEAAFEALEALPSYVIPRSTKSGELRRVMKLSRLLAHDEIEEDGPETATEGMLKVLNAQQARLTRTKQFWSIVTKSGIVEIRGVNWQVGTEIVEDGAAALKLDLSRENIDDIFEAAGRKLGEGMHQAWWRLRVDKGRVAPDRAKLELFALCIDHDVLRAVESAANRLVQKWLKTHTRAIGQLPEGRQQAYNEVRRLAAKPEIVPLTYPDAIEARKRPQTWKQHLFVDGSVFPAKLNRWETRRK